MKNEFDLIVIGAGPGGYLAAIRSAQLGMDVAVVDKDAVGGVCLNWGCIPSKHLIKQASAFKALDTMEGLGVTVDRSTLDYQKVQQGSRAVVSQLTGGIAGLLKRNGVQFIQGSATIEAPGTVRVNGEDNYSANNILVATGSRPLQVPGFECDEQQVLSSNGILALEELPKSIVILGGGAIGCEFSYILNAFGVKVSLVEMAEQLLPEEDKECAELLAQSLSQQGVDVLVGSRAEKLETNTKGISLSIETADGTRVIDADKALVVFGRKPNSDTLGLQELGVVLEKSGHIPVGDYYQTDVSGIYAIGDVVATPALAHVASREGEIAVEHMAGHKPQCARVANEEVPSAIYCEPQLAGFGLREQQLEGRSVNISRFPYQGNGKSIAVGQPEGFVKIICDAETDELLGAHIIGNQATEIIHQLLLVKSSELLPEDIGQMIFAHPTVSEVVAEGMLGVKGKPIHI